MPELPEVETLVRDLRDSSLIGRTIRKAIVFWPRSIAALDISNFCKQVANQTIKSIDRRGKFIVITLNNYTLLIHLRMTGKFILSKGSADNSSHERVQLQLDDGHVLHYEDQRKFGKWYLLTDPGSILSKLGIEPLSKEFTLNLFKKILNHSSQQIKPFLLNQRHVAGLGNIYVDEALWEAKIHPACKVNALYATQITALHSAIIKVLEQGISHMGTTLGSKQANYFSVSGRRGLNQSHLKVFRRQGLPCPRCHCDIIRITLAQRGTHLCPNCQTISVFVGKRRPFPM